MESEVSSEARKSSIEAEMENYLKSELNKQQATEEELNTSSPQEGVSSAPDIVQDLKGSMSAMSLSQTEVDNTELSPESDLSLHTATESIDSEPNTLKDTEMTSEIISVDDIDGPASDVEKPVTPPLPSEPIVTSERQVTPQTQRGANLAISIPRIHVSPEISPKPNLSPNDISTSPATKIPSRKNSSITSQVISEDLKRLESRLEKFVPKSSDGSECSESSDNSGKSVGNASRLHYSQTASSRAKT